MNWFLIKSYLKHLLQVNRTKGKGIANSFAFDVLADICNNKYRYYCFDTIDQLRDKLLNSKEKIEVIDLGAGSMAFEGAKRSVSKLVRYNATSQKQGELIARLVVEFKPDYIIELGTSLGLGSLYLAMPNIKSKLFTIEGCPEITKLANKNITQVGVNNVEVINGDFKTKLPEVLKGLDAVGMVYFDGHHDCDATLDYFLMCLNKASKSAIFIFDDIYWSKGMANAWHKIINHPKVKVSFDLFQFGIVFLNLDEEKKHYVLKGFA